MRCATAAWTTSSTLLSGRRSSTSSRTSGSVATRPSATLSPGSTESVSNLTSCASPRKRSTGPASTRSSRTGFSTPSHISVRSTTSFSNARVTGPSRSSTVSPRARRSRPSRASGCSCRAARPVTPRSPTNSGCPPSWPASPRLLSSSRRCPAATARSTQRCLWCVATSVSAMCSA